MNKWITKTLIVTSFVIVIIAFIDYYVDPYFQYRYYNNEYFYKTEPKFQMPGIVKNSKYKNLLIGGSGLESINQLKAEELFGTKFTKIAVPNSTSKLVAILLENFLIKHNPDLVIYFLRPANFCYTDEVYTHDQKDIPMYLYDSSIRNDYKYLLNIQTLITSFQHLSYGKKAFNLNELYPKQADCNENKVLSYFNAAIERDYADYSNVCKINDQKISIQSDLLKIINKNKNTRFILINIPITALKQKVFKKSKIYLNYKRFSFSIESLIQNKKNVLFLDYRENEDFSTDYSNYCDLTHFSSVLGDRLIEKTYDDYFNSFEKE